MNEQERMAYLEQDTEARYMGPCRRDEYTPHPPQFSLGSPYMICVQSSPLVLPPKDSFYNIEAYLYEIEIVCDDPVFMENNGTDTVTITQDEMRGTFPNAPFILRDDCPIDDLSNTTFSVRGRTCWRIVDSHPEHRGFLVGSGRGYNGIWSDWSDWQTFEDGIAVSQEEYSGPMFYWSVCMQTERIYIDGERLNDIFNSISGEWREVMELVDRLKSLFVSNNGSEIEHIAFTTKRDRREYIEFVVPCNPGEQVVLRYRSDAFDPEYRAVFDRVADIRFPGILSPAYDDDGSDMQDGATLEIFIGGAELPEPVAQYEPSPIPEGISFDPEQGAQLPKPENEEETEMIDPIYGEDSEAQIAALVTAIENERAETQAKKEQVRADVSTRIQEDMNNILTEVRSELSAEAPELDTDLDAEAQFQQRRKAIKAEVKARLCAGHDKSEAEPAE